MAEFDRLPPGWAVAQLREIVGLNPREFDKPPNKYDEVSFVPMPAVEAETGRLDASKTRPWASVNKGYTRFQEGDVLFAKITPCMENGKFALAAGLAGGRGAGSTEFHVLRPPAGLNGKLVLFFLLRQDLRRDARVRMKGAAGQLRVPPEFLAELRFPVAPEREQGRIVAEIEKQFTRLDAAVAALNRVQANLKRYRASVLKAACEGRLVPTEAELARVGAPLVGAPEQGGHGEWAGTGARPYETADQLLARILKERRAKWEADQLAKMQARRGGPPRPPRRNDDDKWKGKYKEPAPADTSNLPRLPEGWAWASLDQLLASLRNGFSLKPDAEQGTRILRISAVRPMQVNLDDVRYLSGPPDKYKEYLVEEGDLLFTRHNGNPELVGVCGVVRAVTEKTVHPDKLIRAHVASRESEPRFLEIVLNTGASRDFLRRRVRTTAGQAGVSGGDLRGVPLCLAPLAEQRRIVAEVELRLSVIDELEATVEADLKRAGRLRQSILKRAFAGKLVPQDPNDEPASVLLERIRAERRGGPLRPPP
jgi:type I restriction enzyme S subunit